MNASILNSLALDILGEVCVENMSKNAKQYSFCRADGDFIEIL